jgi:hypothetical protein
MSKWLRVLIWSSGFALVCGTYLWFFGLTTLYMFQARRIGRQVPITKSVPVDLADLSVSTSPGEKLSFRGMEFKVPWNDVDHEKTQVKGNWLVVAFRSNRTIIVCVTSPGDFARFLYKNKFAIPEEFTSDFGSEAVRSDYSLKQAIFTTTPRDIDLSTSEDRAAILTAILTIKAVMPPTTDWAIYNVKSKEFRGFQFGDPARRPKKMSVELYASDDSELELNFEQKENGPTPRITQAEINRIIQSVHRVLPADMSTKKE